MGGTTVRGFAGRAVLAGMAWFVASLLALPLAAQGDLPRPRMEQPSPPPGPSTDGTLVLEWSVGDLDESELRARGARFELEELHDDDAPMVLDVGGHLATSLSGRDDGRYRYRVRAVGADGSRGEFSAPVERVVAHHPLGLALGLFAVGAVVFVATAGVVLVGHRRARATDVAREQEVGA
ncbi:MAG: fibronectin type III domain-containing protein [Planctomycetes bacterium]|nr:fibronectin type III domain-containing protein [Planctomycetota bacterium]